MPTALIAEDEPMLLAQLKARLAAAWPELEIVAEAPNGEEALALANEKRPDIAFLDIRMPILSGLEVARELAGELPGRDRVEGRRQRRRRQRLRAADGERRQEQRKSDEEPGPAHELRVDRTFDRPTARLRPGRTASSGRRHRRVSVGKCAVPLASR